MSDIYTDGFVKKFKFKNFIQVLLIILSSLLFPVLFLIIKGYINYYYSNYEFDISAGVITLFFSMGLVFTAIVKLIRYYKSGERSRKLWVGITLSVLAANFWIFMIFGELLSSQLCGLYSCIELGKNNVWNAF
ncbi:MAG: hypothetical protein WC503_02360 [Candidatus Shapirobacteria bacterium]|nr:hypothetical protein [Candidatus Methanoperedens sp.]